MTIEPLFSADQIATAVRRMAAELEAHYGAERPGVILLCRLCRGGSGRFRGQ